MKTLKLIGMTLLMVFLAVNFSACSDDDDEILNDKEEIAKEKLLVEFKKLGEETITESYSYDEKNKLISCFHEEKYQGAGPEHLYKYVWYDDQVVGFTRWGEEYYYLSEGLSKSYKDRLTSMNFSYNSQSQLIKCEEFYGKYVSSVYTYEWESNKLMGYSEKYHHKDNDKDYYEYYDCKIKYNNKICKGFNPIFPFNNVDYFHFLYYAHPELVGLRSNYLPNEFEWKDEDGTRIEKYSYVLDAEGYITNCMCETINKDLSGKETSRYTDHYAFKWVAPK